MPLKYLSPIKRQKQTQDSFLLIRSFQRLFSRLKLFPLIIFVVVTYLNLVATQPLSADTTATIVDAKEVSDSSASLNFDVEKPAKEVILVWGPADAGSNINSWDNKVVFTDLQAGDYSYEIGNLEGNSQYYYNIAVGNSVTGYEIQGVSASFTQGAAGESIDSVWFDDALPKSNNSGSTGGKFDWSRTQNPQPYSGSSALQLSGNGYMQHYFMEANPDQSLVLKQGDSFYTYVYLDPTNPPKQIVLFLIDDKKPYPAYWGADYLGIGNNSTSSNIGPLPPAGQWVKLEFPAASIGLEGISINGMSFILYDGKATFDRIGKSAPSQNTIVDTKRQALQPAPRTKNSSSGESRSEMLIMMDPSRQESLNQLNALDTTSEPDRIDSGDFRPDEIVMEIDEPENYKPFGAIPASSSVDAQGNFNYSLPIDLPPGINGMTPGISLSYNSGNNTETTLGRGWSLNYGQMRIERRRLNFLDDGGYTLDKYDETKHGFHLNGDPLRKVRLEDVFYVTDQDMHARISRWARSGAGGAPRDVSSNPGATPTNDFWTIRHKSGIKQTLDYRTIGEKKQAFTQKAEAWMLSEEEDRWGNKITYTYDPSYNIIKKIEYAYAGGTPNIKVEFDYVDKYESSSFGSKPSRVVYKDGQAYHIDKNKLETVKVYVGENLHRTYQVDYRSEGPAGVRLVDAIEIYKGNTETGFLLDTHSFEYHDTDGVGFQYNSGYSTSIDVPMFGIHKKRSLSSGKIQDDPGFTPDYYNTGVNIVDYNNDGLMDVIMSREFSNQTGSKAYRILKNTGNNKFVDATEDDSHCLPPIPFSTAEYNNSAVSSVNDTKIESILIDINGDNLEDILSHNGVVYLNKGYDAVSSKNPKESLWQEEASYRFSFFSNKLFKGNFVFEDFDGDGLVDIYSEYYNGSTISLYKNTGTGWVRKFRYVVPAGLSTDYPNYEHQVYYTDSVTREDKLAYHIPPGRLTGTNANKLVDVNGDGLVDFIHNPIPDGAVDNSSNYDYLDRTVFLNNGTAFVEWKKDNNESIKIPSTVMTKTLGSYFETVRYVDLNNDLLPDLVYSDEQYPDSKGIYLNTGQGWELTASITIPVSLVDSSKSFDLGVEFVDINADGYLDIAQSYEEKIKQSNPQSYKNVYLNDGTGQFNISELDSLFPQGPIAYDRQFGFKDYLGQFSDYLLDPFNALNILTSVDDPIGTTFVFNDLVGIASSLKSHSSNGTQKYFDINGDGVNDSIVVVGTLSDNSVGRDPVFFYKDVDVRLNKRSGDYLRMISYSNNLNSVSINYMPARSPQLYLEKGEPIAGGLDSCIYRIASTQPIVESLTHDIAGNDHKVKYFYGDLAIMPGKGFAFGKSWEVDETLRTVNITSRQVDKWSKGTFGMPVKFETYKFGSERFKFDRNKSPSLKPLLNTSAEYDSGRGLHLVSSTQYFNKMWYSYRSNLHNHYPLESVVNDNTNPELRYEPFFIFTNVVNRLFDPDVKGGQIFGTHTILEPDRFGNIIKSETFVSGTTLPDNLSNKNATATTSNSKEIRSTERFGHDFSYSTDASWIVNSIGRINTSDSTGPAQRLSYQNFTYDGTDKWKLTSIKEGLSGYYVQKITDFEYDSFGNVSKVTHYGEGASDEDKRSVTTNYVTAGTLQGRAISSVTRNDWTTTFSNHDEYTGQPGSVTDPNGLVTSFEYDAYDRVEKTTDPIGRETLVTVQKEKPGKFKNNNIAYTVRTATSGPNYVYTAYDNIGRPLKRWAPGFDWDGKSADADSTWNQAVTEYNENELVESISRPFAYSEGIPYISDATIEVSYDYDSFGRLKKVYGRDGSRAASYDYDGTTVTVMDAAGDTTETTSYGSSGTRTVNAKNGVVYQGSEVTPQGSVSYIRTDADGDGILDKDTMIKNTYDGFGRLIKSEDPSFGTQEFKYNAFDELIKAEKNKGTDDETVIEYIRDDYGRATEITYTGKRGKVETKSIRGGETLEEYSSEEKPERVEKYIFDSVGRINNLTIHYGFLFNKSLSVGGQEMYVEKYTPDEFGRVTKVVTDISEYKKGSGRFSRILRVRNFFYSSRDHDDLGRLSTLTYPHKRGEPEYSVDYAYRENGQLWLIYDKDDDNRIIWAATEADEENFIKSEQLGSNVFLKHEKTPRGLLKNSWAKMYGSDNNLLLATYDYYLDNTMKNRSFNIGLDGGLTTSETFKYDGLKQLNSVIHMGSDRPGSDTFTETDFRFEYDDHSRMIRKYFIDKDGQSRILEFDDYPEIN